MKGYLQRMAANAARPRGGIHPLVGSIYAGPAFAERGTEPISVTEERLLANSPEPVRAGKEVRGTKSDPIRFEIAQPEEGAGERPVERSTEPASLRPPLSKAVRVHDGAVDTKQPNRQYAQQHVRFDDEGHESPHGPEFHYEPLLPREARSPLVTSAVQTVKPETVSRSAPAEREPDKIEIHIGRIEVTAVPQEAPRPATTRARKSLNLGEYLKRRDGRAG